jgi:outer membrane protein assembly factor BamB
MQKAFAIATTLVAGVLFGLSGCGDAPAAKSQTATSPATSTSTGTQATTATATGTSAAASTATGTGATPKAAGTNVRGWRGDGTGTFPDAKPPTEWDEKKNVKWRTMVGAAHSAPIVVGGKVFVTAEKSSLVCLDRATGKQLWSKTLTEADAPAELKAKVKEGLDGQAQAGMATPTPTSDGEGVYVVFGSGVIARFDLNGERKWFRHIEPVGLGYGQSSSPLLADGKLVVYLDGMAALDTQTGKTVWENKEIDKAYGSPVLMTLGNTKVVITPMGMVVGLADGKILAKEIAPDLGGDEFSISPIVHDDVVYYINRSSTAAKLTLQGTTVTAKTLWSSDLEESAFGSPAFYNGLIYFCGKTAHYVVLDAKDGKHVMVNPKDGKVADDFVLEMAPAGGQAQEMANANVYPSVTVAGKNVFLSNDQGQTFVLEATKEYKEVHRNQLPEGSGACLTFDGPDLFIRGGDFLYCVGPK